MATVSGSVVNEGTVTFKDNTTTLCSNVPLNGSGQATCSIAFSTAGSHSITAQYSGSNNFKLSQSAILPQAVTYSFIGFLAPVQNPNAVNVGNTGKTYPIKWQLTDSKGSYISDLASIASLGYYPALCNNGYAYSETATLIENATGGTSLRYDTTANQFIYNWQTPKQPTPACYVFVVKTRRRHGPPG